jgi:hypothetical protein
MKLTNNRLPAFREIGYGAGPKPVGTAQNMNRIR